MDPGQREGDKVNMNSPMESPVTSCHSARQPQNVLMQGTVSQLQKVDMKLVKWKTCSHVIPILTKNMLCAGIPQGGKDACQKTNNKSIWYQLGTASWRVGCGQEKLPVVYTKVSNYLLWINTETTLSGKACPHEPDLGCHLHPSPWAIMLLYFVMLL
ncbi:hypothetical protein MC885_001331 [Smutsia gigantea]|nr:hypothetical protein MC885_001331 [Smutsia gigantea]